MSSIRYAEISDFSFIKGLWESNIDKLSILKDWDSDINESIISSDILIADNIGFCMYRLDKKSGIGFIKGICIREEYRRAGVAREFLKRILGICRGGVVFSCFPNSLEANGFGRSVGYFYACNYAEFDRLEHNYYFISRDTVEGKPLEGDVDINFIKSISLDKESEISRYIVCRFKNKENLDKFIEHTGFDKITKDTEWYDTRTGNLRERSGISIASKTKMRYWKTQWVDMPDFVEGPNEKNYAYAEIEFHFHKGDESLISEIFEQEVPEEKSYLRSSCWYPKQSPGKFAGLRVVGGDSNTRYPIYVVSKNRSKNCSTSRFLSQMEVPHYVVVEPNDVKDYERDVKNKYADILELDMSYKERYDTFDNLGLSKSTGPGPARNFCWDDSIKRGYKWHWVFDDNATGGFFWLYQNHRVKCRTGAMFRAMEDFVDRYDNLAIAGIDYAFSCPISRKKPAFVLNTRIYSFLLIRNDIPYRWRGRYNEDTDLSLRVLKDGWCTLDFDVFLAGKARTQAVKGGNTEEFYSKEGTLPKSKMLQDMHPDVARVSWKFGRWHHEVDYSGFTQKLHLMDDAIFDRDRKINNYGMIVIPTVEKESNDSKTYLETKYKDIIEKVKNLAQRRSIST